MNVCIKCRYARAWREDNTCFVCGTTLLQAPRKWSPPKHNNRRAWKRIEKGEWLWDRRRVARSKRKGRSLRDTVITRKFKTIDVPVDPMWGQHTVKRRVPIEGTEREVDNYGRLPDIDMGG